ncbi:regulatory protein, SyrP-like protein [Legionella nautarum]|uniref:Regulatory protein, SyrP-like protein n=1 Tax=Legionella nautarum TaxID=45070 RepID=A0A0W0WWL2_9GAMM|nr:TauD/TfdA family dioxygenase [Legionella nautarum]KTD36717.1 regulatory protein, SyrP-like protein [Legionella nautarum]
MDDKYPEVLTRFLRNEERLVLSQEQEMPLIIEAKKRRDASFLQDFLAQHTASILEDLAQYGAILLRGFDIKSEGIFEQTVLSLKNFRGISDVFMSEEGRVLVNDRNYVFHTNAVYKTGGTLYLGGFHSENYYSTDVPTYISFCCLKPSTRGGETGLINTEKVYQFLNEDLKAKLEKKSFFVSKWLFSEIAERYQLSTKEIEKLCERFNLPIIGEANNRFILLYKPSVFENPRTQKKALQINFFELMLLNEELRKCFMKDYQGKQWFWHRFVWQLSPIVLKIIERIYIAFASFFHSPKEALQIFLTRLKTIKASRRLPVFNNTRVGSCFNEQDIQEVAQLMRNYYCSCLWQKGDILLIDNRKVVHAGMPGAGPRLIRAMICNPLQMNYSENAPGLFVCNENADKTIGSYAARG